MLNSTLLTRVLGLLRGIVLARLLVPEDFGLFGMATVVTGVALTFADVGAGLFLVYRPKADGKAVDTAFWMNALFATLCVALLVAATPAISRFYGRPDLAPILRISALALWVLALSAVHRSLLRRDARFRALAAVEVVSTLAHFAVGVGLASLGWGASSLAWSVFALAFVTSLLSVVLSGWRPSPGLSRDSLKALGSFSVWYVGAVLVGYLALNLDNFVIGKALGMESLGIYAFAYLYAMTPITLVANPLGQVTFPEIARHEGNEEARWTAFHAGSRVLVSLVAPLAATGIVAAPDLFPLLFGSKWDGAIVPFRILLTYVTVRCLWMDPFSAMGRFRGAFLMGLAGIAVGFPAISLSAPHGVTAVATAVLVVSGAFHLIALPASSGSWRRTAEGLRIALPYVGAAAGCAAIAVAIRGALLTWGRVPASLLLVVGIAVTLGGYLLIFRRRLPAALAMLVGRSP